MFELAPGLIVQHRKHNPDAGEFHKYQIVAIAKAAASRDRHGSPIILFANLSVTHTETLERWELCSTAGPDPESYLWQPNRQEWATESMVIYENVDMRDRGPWARPLRLFIEPGRFKAICH